MYTERKNIQEKVATGRFTLAAATFISLILWMLTASSWAEAATAGVCALTGYLMVELNTAFSLIRTRTFFHISVYWLTASLCVFNHSFSSSAFIPLIFILSLYQLYRSYEESESAGDIFNAFLLLSIGSFIFPMFLYFSLLIYLAMIEFRSFTTRTFIAGILGMLTPWWIYFGYSYITDNIPAFATRLSLFADFCVRDYASIGSERLAAAGFITLISLIGTVDYIASAFHDKTRTRIFLKLLIVVELSVYLVGAIRPCYFDELISIQAVVASIFAAHCFVLHNTKITNILFILSSILFLGWASFNLWIH